ncbi:MAG TPA: response regulator [Tepidisphaeraceae bacterium]|nr:response regulator [Tepidisphaeraceae bacterium]
MGRVLIVDDQLDQCIPLLRMLQRSGHDAACVQDGRSAIDMLDACTEPGNLPDLVLLDVMMPGMDGAEVLRHIRDDPKTAGVPVVMYSAISDRKYQSRLLEDGANDFWEKTNFDFNRMQARFREYLEGASTTLAGCIN